ncbi:agamous-like MADS-box protein AGL61 [Nymphaea colorata]|uniref:MADS-box domain-containing protein n=1 Tax=Nymphaea colorata TaxID=210225 RepID=A0A5K1D235_9MAGN|nr:agamous-like MADS-box protein AGL61 [Nymphaea colorata]
MGKNKGNNNGSGRGGKARMGRQKIEIKRITKEEARQVCFSKRRNGLIKKAGELCILCGAEMALIVFSPAGKAFSYGHPSVDAIFNRFQNPSSDVPASGPDANSAAAIQELSCQHDKLVQQIEVEKKRRLMLQKQQRSDTGGRMGYFWDADLEKLSAEQLEDFKGVLEEMRTVLAKRADELLMGMAMMHQPVATAHSHQFPPPSLAPPPYAPTSATAPLPFNSFLGGYNTNSMAIPFINNNNAFMGASNPDGSIPNNGQYFSQ